jgi:hypothetical protein
VRRGSVRDLYLHASVERALRRTKAFVKIRVLMINVHSLASVSYEVLRNPRTFECECSVDYRIVVCVQQRVISHGSIRIGGSIS